MNAIIAGIAVWKILSPMGQLRALSLSCSQGTSSLTVVADGGCSDFEAEALDRGLGDLDLPICVEVFVIEDEEGGRFCDELIVFTK